MQRSARPVWSPRVLVLPLESRDPCPAQRLWHAVMSPLRLQPASQKGDTRHRFPVAVTIFCLPSFSFWSSPWFIHLPWSSPPLLSSPLFPSLPFLPSLAISFHLFSFLLLRDIALLYRPGCPWGPSGPSLECRQNCILFRGVQSVVGVTCTWHNPTVLSVSR